MEKLNEPQLIASRTLSGPLLILAGAGAGKTKTITSRILNLIKSGVSPSEILAITFTNKAAGEMRERIEKAISADASISRPVSNSEKPFVSTFHALGVHIIKENSQKIGLTRFFSIYDKADSKSAIKEALKNIGVNPKEIDPGKILNIISRQKGLAMSREEYAQINGGDFLGEIVSGAWNEYEKILFREKALDFDDLLTKTLSLLSQPDIAKHYRDIWKYIHVDEYQDTNGVQYRICKILAGDKHNICVVGDIDQNIYSWRGAQLRNILEFEKDFPEAKVILLEENYRSTKTILEVANHIIKKNKFRKEKNLFTKNPTGELISVFEGYDEMSEAEFVANKSKELIEAGAKPEEIAVLYRANFQSRALEEAFLSYGMHYQLVGVKFFERKEIKDALSYLRASLSQENGADLKRIINTPHRGIGKVSLLKIIEGRVGSLPEKTKKEYGEFKKTLEKIAEYAKKEKPSNTLRFIMKVTGLEEWLKNSGDDGEERLENLQELVTLASRYDNEVGLAGIEKMLTDAALQSDQDELGEEKDGVKLMTAHSSKGLEFDFVFIVGLEENLFPHKGMEEDQITNEEDEEERRLFYVALTRARKKVFLSYAQTRMIFGSRQVNIPSEFILEIPEKFTVEEKGNYGLLGKPLMKIDF